MLNLLRKNTKKIIWVMVVLFCIWGAFTVTTQFSAKGQVAGRAFGSDVSHQEFNKLRKATEIFTLTGEREKDPGILHQLTWQNILFAREAKQRGIQVSDKEVLEQVRKLLEAQKVPSAPEIYERWVRSISGASAREFEEMVREMIRIQKLLESIRSQPVPGPSPEEARKTYGREKRKLELEILRFPALPAAQAFREVMLKDKDWRAKLDPKNGPALETPGLLSERDIMLNYSLSDSGIAALEQLAPEAVSEPLAGGPSVFLFRVLKKANTEDDYDAPGTAEKYRQEIIERRRVDRFLDWHQDLVKRSRFVDLMPGAEPQPKSFREAAAPNTVVNPSQPAK